MTALAAAIRPRETPLLLTGGFRPFFLAAGAWAAIALALWILQLTGSLTLPTRFDPMAWHIHEMLFGFAMAAIAGFLLTAIPNWTGRPLVTGLPLAVLAGLWLLGRLACLGSALMPPWLPIVLDLALPAALLAWAARQIIAARNWRNLPILTPVAVFGAANLLMHLEAIGAAVPPGLGWRLGLAGALVLISAIGGRIIPAFTRNWLMQRRVRNLPAGRGWVDRAALATLHTGLLLWAFLPELRPVGFLLVLAGLLNAWRLARWRGAATTAEPLLLVLHLGYAWLAAGVALLGLSLLTPLVPTIAAIHALTAGAVATMVLAVMTRATLGHTGRALTADAATVAIYALITVAALTRMAAAWGATSPMLLLSISALCWIAAFGLFALAYGRMLLAPRVA